MASTFGLEQVFDRGCAFGRSLLNPQHMLLPSSIHTHRADRLMLAELHPVDVNHQQVNLVEAPLQQFLQRSFARFHRFPADVRLQLAAKSAWAASCLYSQCP